MEIWLVAILLIGFGALELMAAFSFNIKIKMINRKSYTAAAALGAFSTMLFMVMAMVAPIVAAGNGVWFIFAGSASMAIGNVSSVLLMVPFDAWWKARESKKVVE